MQTKIRTFGPVGLLYQRIEVAPVDLAMQRFIKVLNNAGHKVAVRGKELRYSDEHRTYRVVFDELKAS